MKKIVAHLNKIAKEGIKYNYSSTQFDLPKHIASDILNYARNISDEELYTEEEKYGRENEIHCTVLYGLIDENPEKTFELLKEFKPFEVTLGKISIFKSEDYDVLKIDVKSSELEKIHYYLEENLENENSHPTYIPHVTLAYVKKGEGDKYVNDKKFKSFTFTVDEIEFSSFNGKKEKMQISASKQVPDYFSFTVGRRKIEVFKNPSSTERAYMRNLFDDEYPHAPGGSPKIRFTYDKSGNRYEWMSATLHSDVEGYLLKMYDIETNQNFGE